MSKEKTMSRFELEEEGETAYLEFELDHAGGSRCGTPRCRKRFAGAGWLECWRRRPLNTLATTSLKWM